MPQDPSRTEKATPKRRQKARDEGSVLRITDLDATLALWINLFLFLSLWSSTFLLMGQQVAYYCRIAGEGGGITDGSLSTLAKDVFYILAKTAVPFLVLNMLFGIISQVIQHGFHISLKPLQPKFDRLNPIPGFKRLFSAKAMVELLKSLVKFLIVMGVAYSVLGDRMHVFMGTMKLPLKQSLSYLNETLLILYRNVIMAMLFLAVADFLYQRYQFEKGQRMTKQEVKDEMKDAEGNPEIKNKQKSFMFQAALRRIRVHVPKASVVITNPTHFAVALKYDETTAAPVCLAKGVDNLAKQIRECAKESGVTIVENPPLARALYWTAELDRPIPPDLYQAVAQVLAYVYRLKGKVAGHQDLNQIS
jgi:flagellar biosynthetic protein FlhB